MPDKLDRCVADVKNDPGIDNPWAVCNASIGELKAEEPDKLLNELDDIISDDASFPPADASYKHTGPMVPTESEHSYENSLEDWRLKEIDDMLAKTATFPTSNSSFKHKTSGLVTRPKPNTFGNTGNETVSVPGSLSAVKIKGKKHEAHSMQEIVFKSILDNKLSSCGCKKKLKETSEGGVGSGRKKIQPHGAKTSDVLTAVRTPKAKPAMPATKTGSPKPSTHFTEQIINSKLQTEGGPGSGPRPGGGKKQPEPTDDDEYEPGLLPHDTQVAIGIDAAMGYIDEAKNPKDLEKYVAQFAPDKKARDEVMSYMVDVAGDFFADDY